MKKSTKFTFIRYLLFTVVFFFSFNTARSQGKVKLKTGIKEGDKEKTILSTQEPSDFSLKLVNNLFAYIGSIQKINIKESFDIDFARAGLDEFDNATILINPNDIQSTDDCASIAILSHEIGHIIGNHLNQTITSELELNADFFSGFLARRLKFGVCSEDVSKITQPFKIFGSSDGIHPTFELRSEKIKLGWEKADEKFTLPNSQIDVLKNVDLFLGISENSNENRPDLHYKVIMSIKPINSLLNQETVFSSIKKVKYTLHYTMRKNYILRLLRIPAKVTIEHNSNKDFSNIIQVWGSFPIRAKVYFNNGKELEFSEDFGSEVKIMKKG